MKTDEFRLIRLGGMHPIRREGVTTPQGLIEEAME
jgi:hypothetical protein